MVKLRDTERVPLDLAGLRCLDDHPIVTEPLAAYRAVSRQLIEAHQALDELDKKLSVVIGRHRDWMGVATEGNHTALNAMELPPLVSEIELKQMAVKQEITTLRRTVAEAEYRLSIARSDARAQIRRQLAAQMAPALAELLQHLEALQTPNQLIVQLENAKQRLLLEPVDPSQWENNLSGRIKRHKQRLSALIPPDEEA
jgi:hypothetical protein